MTSRASGREELWRVAAALQPSDDAQALPRYRPLTAAREEPWSFTELRAAPRWLAWSEGRRTRLVLLTGAVGVARAWRATIDGGPLRRAAEALGDDSLGLILALPPADTPRLPKDPAESGDPSELLRLGGSLLLAAMANQPHLVRRVGQLLPGAPGPHPDAAQARLAVTAAVVLMGEGGPLQ